MSAAQAAQTIGPIIGSDHPVRTKLGVPRELEIVLNGPVGPHRLRDDTIVIDGDGWYRTLTPSATWPAANEVLFSNLNARQPHAGIDVKLDAEIDAIIAEYHHLGLTLTWCVYPWTQPAVLGERLLARGATKSVIQASLGSTALPLKIVDGVEIEQIDPASQESFESYISIMAAGFHLPTDEVAFRRRRYQQLSSGPAPCMRLFLGHYDGVVAGCAAMIVKEDSAHFTGVHVLTAFQARGLFQSLTAARL